MKKKLETMALDVTVTDQPEGLPPTIEIQCPRSDCSGRLVRAYPKFGEVAARWECVSCEAAIYIAEKE